MLPSDFNNTKPAVSFDPESLKLRESVQCVQRYNVTNFKRAWAALVQVLDTKTLHQQAQEYPCL